MGITFCRANKDNFYSISIAANNRGFGECKATLWLRKYVAGVKTDLYTNNNILLCRDTWHTLYVSFFKPDYINVNVNGVDLFNVKDNTFKTGYLSFYTNAMGVDAVQKATVGASFRNIRLTEHMEQKYIVIGDAFVEDKYNNGIELMENGENLYIAATTVVNIEASGDEMIIGNSYNRIILKPNISRIRGKFLANNTYNTYVEEDNINFGHYFNPLQYGITPTGGSILDGEIQSVTALTFAHKKPYVCLSKYKDNSVTNGYGVDIMTNMELTDSLL